MDNRQLVKKAVDVAAISAGGELLPDQADKFIDLTVDESVLLKMVRVERVNNPKGELDRLNIGEPVTEKATENPDGPFDGALYEPVFSAVQYSTVKTRSAFNLTKEAEQANIERANLRNRVMSAFASRMSTDLEMLAIQGDDSIVGASVLDRLLKSYDGWGVQTDTSHILDVGGKNVSPKLFSDMLKMMPRKYLKMMDQMRFLLSPTLWQNYAELLSQRNTTLGDAILNGGVVPRAFGIPIERIPLIPEDLEYLVGTVAYNDGSFIWLTVPKNFIYVILRRFETYWEFKPRKDRWENTTYSQTDCTIENEDMVVKAINVGVSSEEEYGK
jgi:hypothetical protein